MKKYIIIVSVYDQENTQAYPLGGVFASHEDAEKYIADHWQEVKNDHWAKDCVNGEDYYREEFTIGGSWYAQDASDGASIEIIIHEVPDMTGKFPIETISREDLKNIGYDTSNLTDDDMESIASRIGKWYREGNAIDLFTDLGTVADEYSVPEI